MKNCYSINMNIILGMAMALLWCNLKAEATVNPAVESACRNTEFQADCQASITSKLGPVINGKEILLAGIAVLDERATAGIEEATRLRHTVQGEVRGMLMAAISDFSVVKEACTKATDIVKASHERKVEPAEVETALKDAAMSISHVNEIFAIQPNPAQGITSSMQMAARNALRLIPHSLNN